GYFSALNCFLDYRIFMGEKINNPIPAFRRRYIRHKRRYNGTNTRQLISIEKMSELVKEPLATEKTNIKNSLWSVPERDQAISMMFAKTGVRKTENLKIEMSEIDVDSGEIWVKPFAKRTNCLVYIDDETIDVMQIYLKWRKGVVRKNNPYLWITHTGAKLRKDDMYYLTTFYAKRIGVHNPNGMLKDKFGPQCHRHWFTTNLRRSGLSREYRRWLRGDSPEGADDLYDHIDPEEVKVGYLKHIPKLLQTLKSARNIPVDISTISTNV
ncbi:MAG: site-specific integrase, partial [Candidatus Heimdallarchaeota archaeon]|nr:site-specific integrase [Candidatus Heimdallarchaeota archaeon]